jgi:hypothetical protein
MICAGDGSLEILIAFFLFPHSFPFHSIFQFHFVYQACPVEQFLHSPVEQSHLYIIGKKYVFQFL